MVGVGDLIPRNHLRAQGAKPIAAFGFDGGAVVAVFRQAEFIHHHIPGHMGHGVLQADTAGALADHHAQRRARLQALARRLQHDAAMGIAGVGRLDKQHRLGRRLLVGRLLEGGEMLVQQALVVQRNAEQGAAGNIMQGTAHAFLLAVTTAA